MRWIISRLLPTLILVSSPLPIQATSEAPSSLTKAMWVWDHADLHDASGNDRLLAFCQRHGINRIFVEVQFKNDSGKAELTRQPALKTLLEKAARASIAVEALDGHREMSLEKCREDTLQRLDALLAFQAELPESARFAGLHYDMEPYLGERWKNGDEHGVMRETLETMAAIRAKIKPGSGLTVAYDIPSWYDRHPETLAIEFKGSRKNFHQHIQDLSDYIGVMSYRREAVGPGSIVDICEGEFAYGEQIGKKVYPSVETGQLKDEPEITFYGTTPKVLSSALDQITRAKEKSPAFGGIFLHYYESLKTLLEPEKE